MISSLREQTIGGKEFLPKDEGDLTTTQLTLKIFPDLMYKGDPRSRFEMVDQDLVCRGRTALCPNSIIARIFDQHVEKSKPSIIDVLDNLVRMTKFVQVCIAAKTFRPRVGDFYGTGAD